MRLVSETECRIMKEAILRIVLHAAEYATEGQLLLSFAGGSKTMSADMQFAATLFGCDALIQVVDDGMFAMKADGCHKRFRP